MKELKGKVAAVTGAGSGIGRALAENLAGEGCHLALSDIDEKGLIETVGMLEKYHVKVTRHIVDVSDREKMDRYAADAASAHGQVDMIINNAGVTIVTSVPGVSYDDFEWLMNINFWGVVYGTKAFLPYLQKQPEGHVVNISSINGILTWPNHSPYCSAKFAVKGFTEVLLQEMDGTSVRVSCVHPGGIKTNIARNSRFYESANKELDKDGTVKLFDKLAMTTADKAAQIIIQGIKKNKRRIMVGMDAKIMDWLTRLFPLATVKLMGIVTKKAK
ncbi:MAG: SDR family oxidoreductase [Proteobacteria bacterium]|nr:SDR family oxidoreductase [Pseudomonadota bacterium]